jgi:large subunit ribosomal protein L13
MNTTVRTKASEIVKDWHVIDAAGRSLGRLATEAAVLLRGKHKPTYEPHLDDGDFVIIINASQVKVTGRKASQMMYHRHSGYPGGLKTRTYPEMLARFPDRVIERAVKGMLPGGTLGESMMKHLKVYRGTNHPHASQVVGSERARQVRLAAAAAAPIEPMKAPRLRPLSVPAVHVPKLTRREKIAATAAPAPVAEVKTPRRRAAAKVEE